MRRVDALWYQLGFAAVGLGVLVAVVGGGSVPGANVLAGMVSLVGVAAAAGGALLARRRVRGRAPGDQGRTLTVPGDELATLVAAGDDDGTARGALWTLAVAGLQRPATGTDSTRRSRRAGSPGEAEGWLRDGSWTDDDDAAAYLRGDPVGLARRLWAVVAGRHPDEPRAARAADAIARRCGVGAHGEADGGRTVGASTRVHDARHRREDRPGSPTTGQPEPGRDGVAVGDGSDADADDLAGIDPAAVDATATVDVDDAGRERSTGRWYGALALALASTAVGAFAGQPVVLLAGVVCVGAAAYARVDRTPVPDLEVTRTVSETAPDAGDRVRVALTVENVGDATLPELRFRDGTPPGVPVVDGSPEVVTALGPGSAVTFAYAVEAVRGRHAFEPPTAVVRGLAGTSERRTRVGAAPAVLTCVPPLPSPGRVPPVVARTVVGPGRSTEVGGGVEFAGVREYRRGDPSSRIDWRRLARTGERFTIEYVEDRLGEVVVLVDARRPAYCASGRGAAAGIDIDVRGAGDARVDDRAGDHRTGDASPDADADLPSVDEPDRRVPAVESCVSAAAGAAASLLSSGYRVGVAAASPREGWLAPGAGSVHRRRIERELAAAPALARVAPDDAVDPAGIVAGLADRLAGVDAVVFCTPAVDDGAVELARRVRALGVELTVLAPDPTRTDDAWRRAARAARTVRIRRLRAAGATVVDRPFAGTVSRSRGGGR
jgi:uncharacterized repeat protein (TIGR01451 family)